MHGYHLYPHNSQWSHDTDHIGHSSNSESLPMDTYILYTLPLLYFITAFWLLNRKTKRNQKLKKLQFFYIVSFETVKNQEKEGF